MPKKPKQKTISAWSKVNIWEDQTVEEAASDLEALHQEQSKPSLSPSSSAHQNGNA